MKVFLPTLLQTVDRIQSNELKTFFSSEILAKVQKCSVVEGVLK